MIAYPVTDTDLDVVARTLFGEARGEGELGQVAVAWVIRNRAASAKDWCLHNNRTRNPLFGDGTPASACQMPWQFSCWNANDPNRAKLLALPTDDLTFKTLRDIAVDVFNGSIETPIVDATHYVVNRLVGLTDWTNKAEQVAVIGNHTFFRAVP